MRLITVPDSIPLDWLLLEATKTHPTWSFLEYIKRVLVTHQDVASSPANIDMFMEIQELFKDAKVGSTVELSNETHEFLANLAKTTQMNADVKGAVLPFIKAIISAPLKAKKADAEEAPRKSKA